MAIGLPAATGDEFLAESLSSNARDGFDAIGVVVDWIDACKQRRLDDLLDLYDVAATVECCEGGSFRGRSEMERYWRLRSVGERTARAPGSGPALQKAKRFAFSKR
jgi:hypothetical protein